MNSPQFTLNKIDWKKIGEGALVATGGAAVTYAVQIFGQFDFGPWQPIAYIVFSASVNALRKYLSGVEN